MLTPGALLDMALLKYMVGVRVPLARPSGMYGGARSAPDVELVTLQQRPDIGLAHGTEVSGNGVLQRTCR